MGWRGVGVRRQGWLAMRMQLQQLKRRRAQRHCKIRGRVNTVVCFGLIEVHVIACAALRTRVHILTSIRIQFPHLHPHTLPLVVRAPLLHLPSKQLWVAVSRSRGGNFLTPEVRPAPLRRLQVLDHSAVSPRCCHHQQVGGQGKRRLQRSQRLQGPHPATACSGGGKGQIVSR